MLGCAEAHPYNAWARRENAAPRLCDGKVERPTSALRGLVFWCGFRWESGGKTAALQKVLEFCWL